jgi:TolB protein
VLIHPNHDSQPVVSPDGKLIAFTATSDGNAEIYLMNSDGSGLMRLTRDLADDQWPQWSPDGKKLMFVSNRTGKTAIYEVAL